MKTIAISIFLLANVVFGACGRRSVPGSDNTINPRDTVTVPEGHTDEDSIAYIENTVLQSPISAEYLLELAEVHSIEERLFNYNNEEKAKELPEYAEAYRAMHRNSTAMRLANQFMRMANLVDMNDKATNCNGPWPSMTSSTHSVWLFHIFKITQKYGNRDYVK